MRWCYGDALYKNDDATLDDLREAVVTFESIARLWKRILGEAHPETPKFHNALKRCARSWHSRSAPRRREYGADEACWGVPPQKNPG